MKKFLTFLVLSLLWCNISFSKDVKAAVWSNESSNAFNKCMPIISFICTMSQDVKTDVNYGSINSHLTVFDKNGTCWLTPQPIRRYTTYFVATDCIAK